MLNFILTIIFIIREDFMVLRKISLCFSLLLIASTIKANPHHNYDEQKDHSATYR